MASALCPLPTLPAAAMGQRDSQASVHPQEPLSAHFREGGPEHMTGDEREKGMGRQEEPRKEGGELEKNLERGQRGGEVEGTREDMRLAKVQRAGVWLSGGGLA